MFYVSSYRENLIGVTDTKDNVEEFYSQEFLSTLNIEIIRFNKELPKGYKFETDCFEFTLIEGGWQLRYKKGNIKFHNKCSYLGYDVISLNSTFLGYNENSIEVGGMDTSKVIDMKSMFASCKNLVNLNLSNFKTDNVTCMSFMFDGCSSIQELSLNNFNTNKVQYMQYMFSNCSSLITLNLSSFKLKPTTNILAMISYCSSLETIDLRSVYDGDLSAPLDGLFIGCYAIANFMTNSERLFNCAYTSKLRLMEFKQGVTYDCKIAINKDTKFTSILPKLLTKIKKGTVGYTIV